MRQPPAGLVPGRSARRLPARLSPLLGLGLGLGLLALALAAPAPARAGVVQGQPLDGPSPDLLGVGGVAMAADGGGAVAYLRNVGGTPHVFVAVLTAGAWSAPVRLDGTLPAGAAQPVVAASAGGRIAVAFLSGGALYATVRLGRASPFTAPQQLAAGASDPSLSMGASGTAYLSYAVPIGDLLVARLDRTASAFVGLPGALDAAPSGAGSGPALRSRVAVAADATGLVAWGQAGGDGRTHVLVRRVYGLHLGGVVVDVTLDQFAGVPGESADLPDVGVLDDSSYAWIAFRQSFGGLRRALVRPLVGYALGAPQALDGTGASAAGAPSLAVDGVGDGLAATALADGTIVGTATGADGFGPGQPANQVAAAVAPHPVAAVSRSGDGLIAFATAQGGIEGRQFAGGVLMAEAPLSRPDLGPIDAAGGLAAEADNKGDALVAFLQGGRLVAAAVVNPPGTPVGLTTDHFVRSARPTLRWTAARAGFSPVSYAVMLDGAPIGTTAATSLLVPAPLADGLHHWQVIARDSLGQQTPALVRALRIAARPPVVTLAVTGSKRAGSGLTFKVAAQAVAGLGAVQIQFGDGSRASGATTHHTFRHSGRFTVRVVAFDRVGNRAALRRSLKIA